MAGNALAVRLVLFATVLITVTTPVVARKTPEQQLAAGDAALTAGEYKKAGFR